MLTFAATRPVLFGFLGALVGSLLAGLVYHLYLDHLLLHELTAYLNAVAPKLAKLP